MMSKVRSILCLVMTVVLLALSCAGLAELQQSTAVFIGLDKVDHAVPVDFDEDWFDGDNDVYRQNLARTTLCMAMSAFRATPEPVTSDRNVQAFFRDLGFEEYQAIQFDRVPETDTISTAMALRHMEDEEGPYTLIAVAVCGQGYGNEWVSNFTVGTESQHTGFQSAARQVYSRFVAYRNANAPHERVKLWMGGFSRAAAVSNLTADMVLSSGVVPQDSVYVYTFATPNCTREPREWPCIFNICNTMDVVPKIPLGVWGFRKHGVTRYLPSRQNTLEYDTLADRAAAQHHALALGSDGFGSMDERDWLLDTILRTMSAYLPEAVETEGLQKAISAAWVTKGSMTDKM